MPTCTVSAWTCSRHSCSVLVHPSIQRLTEWTGALSLSVCLSVCRCLRLCLRLPCQIYLYRNGDKHHTGEEMTLNPKLVKNIEQVMDKANGSVKLVTGGE